MFKMNHPPWCSCSVLSSTHLQPHFISCFPRLLSKRHWSTLISKWTLCPGVCMDRAQIIIFCNADLPPHAADSQMKYVPSILLTVAAADSVNIWGLSVRLPGARSSFLMATFYQTCINIYTTPKFTVQTQD